jgi:hypothetical protein
MSQVSFGAVRSAALEGVGHYAALEAPDQVARGVKPLPMPSNRPLDS